MINIEYIKKYVPEVPNGHVNDNLKKSTFFIRIFFRAMKNYLSRKKMGFFKI